MTPPQAKPNAGAAMACVPNAVYDHASRPSHATPQCVQVRCVIHRRRDFDHHATSIQSGAVLPSTAATNTAALIQCHPPIPCLQATATAMTAAAQPVA